MKRLKLLPSILMMVLCVGVLCMGIYAASPNSNQITGSITINPANAAVDIVAWAEKYDGTESDKITLTDVRTGGETISFNDAKFADILKLDFSSATTINDVKPCYIKVQITNKSSAKELGAYFSTHEVTTTTVADDIFTTAPLTNNSKIDATSIDIYGWMDEYSESGTANTTTITLEFRANGLIEEGTSVSFNNYYINIEEYVATYTTLSAGTGGGMGPPTAGNSEAPALVRIGSSIESIPERCFSNNSSENTNLRMIIAPKVTSVGDYAFANTSTLSYAVMPELTGIGGGGFIGAGIKYINFEKLEQIGSNGLSGQEIQIERAIFPKTLTRVHSDTFSEATISEIYYKGTKAEFMQITGYTAILSKCDVYCEADGTLIPKTV